MPLEKHALYASLWTLFWLASFVALVFVSIGLCEGHLIYSLDDPYIHLAVAKNILHGGYGVNAGEFSSPSSSILYPFLLVPFVAIGLGEIGPLLINIIAMGFSVWLLLDFFWRYSEKQKQQRIFALILSPLLILSINAYGLPMTGMEHSLHVLAVIVAIRGLAALFETGKLSPWLMATIIAMPFIRFEGTALSAAALIAIYAVGKRRAALQAGAIIIAGFALWALFMHQLGLPFLPSSVLAKSEFARSANDGSGFADVIAGVVHGIADVFAGRWGIIFTLMILGLILSTLRTKESNLKSPRLLVAGVMIAALTAHFLFGKFGWLNRYEVYAVALFVTGSIYLMQPIFTDRGIACQSLWQAVTFIALAVMIQPYALAVYYSPLASRNIYEQHYQMHRFAADYFPHRVAAGDLGWVSYGNQAYVLDLSGLGSERARRIMAASDDPARAVADLIKESDIDYVMLYDIWFRGKIPATWCRVAVLHTQLISAGAEDVSFYATKPSVIPAMNEALDRFAPTLPERDVLVRTSCVS